MGEKEGQEEGKEAPKGAEDAEGILMTHRRRTMHKRDVTKVVKTQARDPDYMKRRRMHARVTVQKGY
jgi:hypothetical protein